MPFLLTVIGRVSVISTFVVRTGMVYSSASEQEPVSAPVRIFNMLAFFGTVRRHVAVCEALLLRLNVFCPLLSMTSEVISFPFLSKTLMKAVPD